VTGEAQGLIGESLRRAWETFKRDSLIVMGLALLGMVVAAVPEMHKSVYHPPEWLGQFFSALWWIGAGLPLTAGVQYGMLRVLRGERVGARDLFLGYPKLGHLLLCYFCAVVLGLLGLILLVVPGVILFLGFSQCLLLTLDQGERGLGGLERSWRMMKGFRIRFLGLVLVNVGICLLGLLLLGVGLVPAAAITSLAMVAFYDRVLALHPGLPDAPQRPGPA